MRVHCDIWARTPRGEYVAAQNDHFLTHFLTRTRLLEYRHHANHVVLLPSRSAGFARAFVRTKRVNRAHSADGRPRAAQHPADRKESRGQKGKSGTGYDFPTSTGRRKSFSVSRGKSGTGYTFPRQPVAARAFRSAGPFGPSLRPNIRSKPRLAHHALPKLVACPQFLTPLEEES